MRVYSLYVGFNDLSVNGKVVENPFLFGAEKETIEDVIKENPILQFLDDKDVKRLYADFDEAERLFREEPGDYEFVLNHSYAECGGIWREDGWHCIYSPESLNLPGVRGIVIVAKER